MLFVFPTPQYPRRPVEYVFKSLYLSVTSAHVLSLVVLIADFYTRLGSSMPEYFTNSDLVIADGLRTILENCTYTGELHLQNVRGHVDVSLGSLPYYLMTTAQYVTALFVVEFIFIVNNVVCATMYSAGDRHRRVFGIHIPMYTILCCCSYFYCFALIVITWSFEGNRQFFKRGLQSCANKLLEVNASAFYESEYDGTTIFTTAVYWPFAATCYTLVIFLLAILVLGYNSYDPARILLSEADAPWEARGFFCTTSKPLLKLHTTQRNAIVSDARKAICEGQKVRIVRSYQLMTEEDFKALEAAMREQVEELLKEQRFMKLKENFGDTESQIEHGGLFWRAQLMAPPAELSDAELAMMSDEAYGGETPPRAGDGGEAFYDVDFGQYFDGNGTHLGRPNVAASATEMARHNDPGVGDDALSYPNDVLGGISRRTGMNTGDDGRGDDNNDLGFYDDEINLRSGDGDAFDGDAEAFDDGRFPRADFHDFDDASGGADGYLEGGDADTFEPGRHRSHHHSHRRHRHRSSSRQARGGRGGGDFREEPEARRPISEALFNDALDGDAFSPAEGDFDGRRGGGGGVDNADGFVDEL